MKPTMTHDIVVAFLESVDANGLDIRKEVHLATEAELACQLDIIAERKGLYVPVGELDWLAGRLQEIVRKPDGPTPCPECGAVTWSGHHAHCDYNATSVVTEGAP